MEGHGYYTEHSQAQQAYGELGIEWLEQAAATVEAPPRGMPFTIADLGAAGGGSSLEPMRRALAARRGEGPALVVHTDIPSNDFSALFEYIDSDPGTYLGAAEVFALAAGRSFYERLFPEGFLSLGWSSIAVHWLSEVPVPIADHIYCSFADGGARDALRERSARDWRAFLDHRAHELRPSGRLIVIGGAAEDDGTSGAEGLMDAANAGLRALVEHGALSAAEYERMTIPTWNRTLAEFAEPFESGEFAGRLELRRKTLRWLPDGYFQAYEDDRDLDRYADAVTGFFRAAFEQSLLAGLDPERTPADREALAAALRENLRERVAADPMSAACRWHVVLLEIVRV
jgi:SAM dependent carboxyl methyltransferase